MHKVFVYGSLKRGFGNHMFLEEYGSKFLATTQTKNSDFAMFSLGVFPAVQIVNENGLSILGELFEVNDETMATLDRLEGHPSLYRRKEVELDTGDKAWIYLMQSYGSEPYGFGVDIAEADGKRCYVWVRR